MKLLEQMQQKIKMQGLIPKTFETYAQHCEDFFRFLLKRFGTWKHPKDVAITCNGGYNTAPIIKQFIVDGGDVEDAIEVAKSARSWSQFRDFIEERN